MISRHGFNPSQIPIVFEPLPKIQKNGKVLSANSSKPPSKHTRTTSPVNCEPVPGPRKTQKTPPPADGPSVSCEANKMDTKSSNDEDNNPSNYMDDKNPMLLTMIPPKFQKKKYIHSHLPCQLLSSNLRILFQNHHH
ncbi:hypothetical protein O181_005293 [Austropuccinia psidii MF-1]|uniref:Uncharacterized protein n=1 Tax=Austropuccinia psidii MF-1 TaxID=1389203 RepID=A0A9Q3GFD9_9BASI|nr:hypothetical protein [Austropuccinia psidii MF-1]